MDTIFALATAAGRSGVAIIRISGPQALLVGESLCGDNLHPRTAHYREIVDKQGQHLDSGLILFFDSPNSFTGEDVVELQVHGSIAIIDAILSELAQFDACRLADPGEFTRRALTNGKMDLTQVEGLADLIDAETESQRQQAQALNSGKLRDFVKTLRNRCVRASALLAASIDFADEEIPDSVSRETIEVIRSAIADLDDQINGYRYAERVRLGFEVAIVGAPNVGKSTLLNTLAKRDAAITSSKAGTTRDVIEVKLNLDGLPVTLLDTAGLREATDVVEREGIRRALERAKAADVRIVLTDGYSNPYTDSAQDDIVVISKADLDRPTANSISCVTGHGIEDLLSRLTCKLRERADKGGLVSHVRQKASLEVGRDGLKAASEHVEAGEEYFDLAVEELRTASLELDSVIGKVDVENLLDEVFSSFCLGK